MKTRHLFIILALAALAFTSCRNENITIKGDGKLFFPSEAGHKDLTVTTDCNWSIEIDGNADWFSVEPMSGTSMKEGVINVSVQESPDGSLRQGTFTIISSKGKAKAKVMVTQNLISLYGSDVLWFDHRANQSQTLEISANCDWHITIEDDADWYKVEPMSGGRCNHDPMTITTLPPVFEGDYRSSSFLVVSNSGEQALRVRLSQNIIEIESLTNTIFSPFHVEHWNTDFYGMVIEDSYINYNNPNPEDTLSKRSYAMYFREDSIGMQSDNMNADSTLYFPFTYSYNPETRILYIDFATTEEDAVEDYSVTVLTATNEVFRFMHEYKEDSWEMAAMTKIGDITPSVAKKQGTKPIVYSKRKGRGPIFQF